MKVFFKGTWLNWKVIFKKFSWDSWFVPILVEFSDV